MGEHTEEVIRQRLVQAIRLCQQATDDRASSKVRYTWISVARIFLDEALNGLSIATPPAPEPGEGD